MRSLAAILYILILGFLIVAGYLVDDIGTQYYQEEISEEYLHYSKLITTAIEQNPAFKNTEHNSQRPSQTVTSHNAELNRVLNFWRSNVGKELVSLKVIDKPGNSAKKSKGTVSSLSVTDKTDKVTVVIPLSNSVSSNKALQFDYISEYSDDYMAFYYLSTLAVYTFLALIVTLIAWVIYRYIHQISRVTHSVAEGDFKRKMSPSKIPALKKLSDDINSMASTIEEKTSENLILTGAIHHELRIPITRIRLALDIALNQRDIDEQNKELSDLLSGMDQDLEELSSLTEEILTIARMRLSSAEIKIDEVQFPALLTQLTQTTKSAKVKLLECGEFTLKANHTLLERALLNIINNAIKHAAQIVEIKGEQEQNYFVISVIDDGPGIPLDKRDAVFKPFYRTDKSRNRQTGGFGLGLAIADMVIKDCGGKIKISESRFGGAKVDVCLPLGES